MKSKKQLLKNSFVYVILDKDVCAGRSIRAVAKALRGAHAGIVQLRDKHSCSAEMLQEAIHLAALLKNTNTLFIVNDRPDIATLANADGLHLGQDDIPIREARKIMGTGKIIGVSCSSLREALKAQKEGADYIGVGPIFTTPVKPCARPMGIALLKIITRRLRIPVFAIGGINTKNTAAVCATGVTGVAVCRDICTAQKPKVVVNTINSIFYDAIRIGKKQ